MLTTGEGADRELECDAALVKLAQRGEMIAFDTLLRRYHEPLRRYLLRQSGDPELAADLLQETFLDAYRSLDRLTADRPFAAWLYQIAHNNLRREWRARRMRRLVSLDWLRERPGKVPPALSQADASTATEVNDLVQRTLDDLSPKLREALLLHILWGLTAPEIARTLGISPDAAAQRLTRANEHFRQRRAALWGQ
jgi:RNA polymerase sigma-70 factor (ECF subfamily)